MFCIIKTRRQVGLYIKGLKRRNEASVGGIPAIQVTVLCRETLSFSLWRPFSLLAALQGSAEAILL